MLCFTSARRGRVLHGGREKEEEEALLTLVHIQDSPTRGQGRSAIEQGGFKACSKARSCPWSESLHLRKDLGLFLLKGSWGWLSSLHAGLVQERSLHPQTPSLLALLPLTPLSVCVDPSFSVPLFFCPCFSSGWSITLACPGHVALLQRFGELSQGMYKAPCTVPSAFLMSLTCREAEDSVAGL